MSWEIKHGDWVEVLRTLPDESVHCCVTSPPYWGLRDYGTAKWEGGSPDCGHTQRIARDDAHRVRRHDASTRRRENAESYQSTTAGTIQYSHVCRKCGATRIDQQLGLERTPEEYVAKVVAGFREVRRVLRDDGTLWLNLGDTYAGSRCGENKDGFTGRHVVQTDTFVKSKREGKRWGGGDVKCPGLKQKDLVGIPWMVAFTLRSDGWYLRQDIIWSKPNPMPESVTDRCTKAHEYLFLLSKSARYYFNQDAIREPLKDASKSGKKWTPKQAGSGGINANRSGYFDKDTGEPLCGVTANKKSVWTVTTQGYSEAHFATFPPKLIEPCILAGCPEGGIVLDPFSGAGTTGLVATRLHRSFIGIELNQEYIVMAHRRIEQDAPLFNTPAQQPQETVTVGRDPELSEPRSTNL